MIRLLTNDEIEKAIANGSAAITDQAERAKFVQRRRDLVQTLRSVPAGKEKELLEILRENLPAEEKAFLDTTLAAPVFALLKSEETPVVNLEV